MKVGPPPSWTPSVKSCASLFGVGATVGPLVDGLHNQVLLEYHVAPVHVEISDLISFSSSWAIPPLLGIAYVVLGGILPRIFEKGLQAVTNDNNVDGENNRIDNSNNINENVRSSSPFQEESSSSRTETTLSSTSSTSSMMSLSTKALLAVTSTAAIIRLSDFLVTHPDFFSTNNLFGQSSAFFDHHHVELLMTLALMQWAWLDGTVAALLAASITSIGGPLSELPFVAAHVWDYLPSAADYFPLQTYDGTLVGTVFSTLLGKGYNELALSSITGPCYFAVTMDAIALGRWFDSFDGDEKR